MPTGGRAVDRSETHRDPRFWEGLSRGRAGLLTVVALAHLALLGYGLTAPEASLRFDRAPGRLDAARRLAQAGSWEDAVVLFRTAGSLGDYGWHALLFRVAGESVLALQSAQLALLVASMLALRRIVLDLDGRPSVAWTAVVLYAVIPIDFMIPHFLASEAVFAPLLVLGTCALFRANRGTRPLLALATSGACYGLAALTRGDLLPWLPVACAFVALMVWRIPIPERALRVLVFTAPLLAAPLGWIALRSAAEGELAFGGGSASVEGNFLIRMSALRAAAGEAPPARDEADLVSLAREAVRHPALFAREWLFHSVKLLALPENLDTFRYFDLYEATGRRSELVHTLGWVGAMRVYVAEMPLGIAWLSAGAVFLAVIWLAFVVGATMSVRAPELTQRLLALYLLTLPAMYVALRAVSEGEARKRAPIDFVLATFASIGMARVTERIAGQRRG